MLESAPREGGSGPGQRGVWSRGSGPGGFWSMGGVCSQGGCSPGGYIPACTEADPPVDRQTPVKILPWPNFVAAGNYLILWVYV